MIRRQLCFPRAASLSTTNAPQRFRGKAFPSLGCPARAAFRHRRIPDDFDCRVATDRYPVPVRRFGSRWDRPSFRFPLKPKPVSRSESSPFDLLVGFNDVIHHIPIGPVRLRKWFISSRRWSRYLLSRVLVDLPWLIGASSPLLPQLDASVGS